MENSSNSGKQIRGKMTSIAWKQPDPFSFVAEDWQEWKEVFTSFRRCSKLYKEGAIDQINTLYYTMGAVEAKKIAATFKFAGKYTVAGEEKYQKEDDFDCVLISSPNTLCQQ